ncbi:MAG: (2Fe-2S)-binding protein [Acidobacteria bacterium]|nr:(2Fe-2S)-binding protein [Acidobacteriota bacterium]
MEKVTITLNGQQIETTTDKTVLQTALDNGIHIPHYCYHPGLSIAGNCRMCLVEIEGIPKLQISCNTFCRDGMVVHSTNDRVRKAVRQVLEFLLINHPLDCPVCDQAGECWLQIYYMTVGQYDSRFTGNKVIKHKKATPIGKWVMLDQERCITCSRCVRFTREISKTNEMVIFNRGDHCEINTYPGRELENRYSANIMDICPVGALTCRDFRFKCRVWYLESADSICPSCARGCNIVIHHNPHRPHKRNGARVMRLKPRYNPEVNKWWLCDDGRYNYRFIDQGRLRHCSVLSPTGREQLYLDEGLRRLAELLRQTPPRQTLLLLSAHSSNEEAFAARRLFDQSLGCLCKLPDEGVFTGDQDDFLIREDKHPNTNGVLRIFGWQTSDLLPMADLLDFVAQKNIKVLLVNRHELSADILGQLDQLECRLVYLGTNVTPAAEAAYLAVPLATFAEKEGTFTNCDGRVQKFSPAFLALGDAAPEWEIYSRLAQHLGLEQAFPSAAEVFEQLRTGNPFFQKLEFHEIGAFGELGAP